MALLLALFALSAIPAHAATSTSYTDDATFESNTLAEHNVFRAEYGGVPNLVWNDTLASYATTYASSSCTFKHSGGPYGENIAAGYSDAIATVDAWGDEGLEYDFSNPGFTESTGHFTQIVWKSTTDVGCGRVSCDGTDGTPGEYVVCEYYPAGNIVGNNNQYFIDNVLPLSAVVSTPATTAVAAAASSTVEAGIFAAVTAATSTVEEVPTTSEIPVPTTFATSSSSIVITTPAPEPTTTSTTSTPIPSIAWVTVTTDVVEIITVTKTAAFTATAFTTYARRR